MSLIPYKAMWGELVTCCYWWLWLCSLVKVGLGEGEDWLQGSQLRLTLVDLLCFKQCFFFPRLYLPRNELDNPHKQKTWKIYRPEFAVEVDFDEVVANTWCSVVPFLGQNHVLHNPCHLWCLLNLPPCWYTSTYIHVHMFLRNFKYLQSKRSVVLFLFWRRDVRVERTTVSGYCVPNLRAWKEFSYQNNI